MSIHQQQDRLSKWFIEQQTGAFLKLCQFTDVVSYRMENSELIVPKRIPDALMKVTFSDSPVEVPFIIEFESYPSEDNHQQMAEAMMAYYLSEKVWPDALLIVLKPSRDAEPNVAPPIRPLTQEIEFVSPRRGFRASFSWRTIRVWEIEAEALFALNDPALVPMIPLTQSTQSPEELIRRCRKVIDESDHADKKNLLLITELVAGFVYNDEALLEHLKDPKMIEFPIINKLKEISKAEGIEIGRNEGIEIGRNEGKEIGLNEGKMIGINVGKEIGLNEGKEIGINVGKEIGLNEGKEIGRSEGIHIGRTEARQAITRSILDVLETRFGPIPESIIQRLEAITDIERLRPFVMLAALCPHIQEFEQQL